MKRDAPEHPLGSHSEIGWRFCRDAWGKGFATRSARLALQHAWTVLTMAETFSYSAKDNMRSQQVMQRLEIKRADDRDFTASYPKGNWSGLVWVAERPLST